MKPSRASRARARRFQSGRRSVPCRTGYTVHTGANEKFVAGWDQIFGGKKSARKSAAKKAAAGKQPVKKTAKKSRRRKS